MKRVRSLFLLAGVLYITSCNDALNTVPSDFVTPINYYQTEAQLNNALNGVYDPLGQEAMYGNALLTYLSYGNDEGVWRATGQVTGPMVYNYDPSETNINALWTALYYGINRANVLLDNIDKAPVEQAKKDKIKGQALFLRAYYYFMLVDNWGDVPVRLHATESANDVDLARTPATEVYDLVVKDMELAESLLPTAADWGANSTGRISKNTAAGMLARVYLSMAGAPLKNTAKYQDALKWSKKVIDMNQNALNPDFAQIFINHSQDKYDVKECLWEVEFWGNKSDSFNEVGYVGVRNGIPSNNIDFPGYGYGFLYATQKLYSLYEAKDLRRDWTVSPYYWNDNTKTKVNFTATQVYDRFPAKWRRDLETNVPRNKNLCGTNFPLLRYSDVLLMFAEAENQVNGPTVAAYDAVNQVRRRGYGKLLPGALNPKEADLPAGLSQTEFLETIKQERMRELAFECLRTHDLKRWGDLVSTLKEFAADITQKAPANRKFTARVGENVTERHFYYPIPSREISLNKKIIQNPGW